LKICEDNDLFIPAAAVAAAAAARRRPILLSLMYHSPDFSQLRSTLLLTNQAFSTVQAA